MDPSEALERIEAIHSHLARAEQYRGYRPHALFLSGLAGLLAALFQPLILGPDDPLAFVHYWLGVAVLGAALAGGATVIGYFWREDAHARRRTRIVMGQFLPCLLAGAALTLGLVNSAHLDVGVMWLPGLWALTYGLGTVASLPYLPRAAGYVAAWYLGWGMLLFYLYSPVPPGWSVGLPFGIGQLLAAGVLLAARREQVQS